MTDTKSRRKRKRASAVKTVVEPVAAAATQPVTGVARGGMGTAANLEETQVLRTEDLRSWAVAAAAEPEQRPEPAAEPAPEPAAEPAPVAAAPVAVAAVAAAPVAAATRTRRATRSPGRDRFAGLAGMLAILFVVLAGAAFLVSRDDGSGPAIVPAADATQTPAPTEDRGGKKDEKGNCKGKGHGDNCDEDGGD